MPTRAGCVQHRTQDRCRRAYAKSMRARSTRLAGLVRDRVIAISFVTSSSPMANSTTSRGAAMMQGLVQQITEPSYNASSPDKSRSTHRFHGIGALVIESPPWPRQLLGPSPGGMHVRTSRPVIAPCTNARGSPHKNILRNLALARSGSPKAPSPRGTAPLRIPSRNNEQFAL